MIENSMDVAGQNNIEVNLCNKVDIAKSLSRVVSTSFGPSCLSTMLTTSTGAVLVTSQGIAILKSLQIAHPLARVIVDAVVTHHSSVGDGTKMLLLLLEHSLQAVQEIVDKQASCHLGTMNIQQQMNNYLSNKIALALGKFSNTILSDLFTEVQQRADMLDADCCRNVLRDRMFSVLVTTISSHFSSAISQYFATLLMDSLITKTEVQNLESTRQTIGFILDNFEFMHVKSPGQSYKESSTLNGFLLQRNFSFHSDNLSKMEMKCILLKCPIEGVLSNDNATVRLKSDDTLKIALSLKLKNAKLFLQTLSSRGVTLIVSTEKVPDYVLSLCRTFDISVICCVDEDDIEFLEKLSGKFVIHNTWDVVDDSVVINLSECRRVSVGSRVCVQLGIEKGLSKQLILCAPTDSMCHQLGDIVYKAFKSLFMCFQKIHISQSSNNVIYLADKKQKVSSVDISAPSMDSLTNKSSDNNSSLDDRTMMSHEIPLDDGVTCVMSSEISLDDDTLDTLKFITFPGGGYFEYMLAELLDQRMKICPNQEMAWCCQILTKSLTAIPFALHKNLSQNAGARSFLEKDLHIRAALKNNCPTGFNSGGCVCNPAKENILEPPFAKMAVVTSVIQLLQQLLKIDGIVGVKTVKT
ncbi:Bardet-Biedl syndrome 10 protein-like [Gigantopelta aegis]|uniref:Bardet-Biedl syndrome 10 protein-like n=1 Tax=Gigantopelta aegis TaxID=1735272 RepID=UPI001B88A542|nr:Bardet-Biedl syndrome 10 protein-like [Gigantopelta aegis]